MQISVQFTRTEVQKLKTSGANKIETIVDVPLVSCSGVAQSRLLPLNLANNRRISKYIHRCSSIRHRWRYRSATSSAATSAGSCSEVTTTRDFVRQPGASTATCISRTSSCSGSPSYVA